MRSTIGSAKLNLATVKGPVRVVVLELDVFSAQCGRRTKASVIEDEVVNNRPEEEKVVQFFVLRETIDCVSTSMAGGLVMRLKASTQACGARGLRLWRDGMLKIEEIEEKEEEKKADGGNPWL